VKFFSKESIIDAATGAIVLVGVLVSATLISTTVTADDMKHQSMNTHAGHNMQHSAGQMMAEEVITKGVINGVLSDSKQLKVHHQPIPEWTMSEMQMKFFLAPDLSISDFSEGQQIHFRLKQENMMKFTITELLD